MNTDRMSSVYYQSHTEPNIYFQPQFKTGAAARNTNPTALLNSRYESSEGNSGIQQRDTVKDTNEQLKKQMKKIKVLMIVAVSVIGAFLALAIGLAFLALIHSQKQLPLPDIDEEVTKHVAPLQGNLTLLNNQLNNIYAKQLNELAQQVNESAEQTQTLNDISGMINDDLAEYAQQTRRIEDSINQNQAIIEQMRNNNNSTNLPSKFMHVYIMDVDVISLQYNNFSH